MTMSSEQRLWITLYYLLPACAVGAAATANLIPKFHDAFIRAGIFGVDMSKRRTKTREKGDDDDGCGGAPAKVPEAMGVITGCVFLMVTFVLIPLTVWPYFGDGRSHFPHSEFAQLLAALLSISCTLLLGFADDVLDLRWRDKLLLPTMASLPLLMVYYVTADRTDVVVPVALRHYLGTNVDLGALYYVYMGMLAVFCTNAINIYAGINGLEVGQAAVIALSVVAFNLKEVNGVLGHYHRFSLYFLLPYLATSLPLLYFNWYPSRVFCGDTFCYFSGMTLAVVAILGHFSKTVILFFIPQTVNFLYSSPQLFRLVPCPRHRLPRYDPDGDVVGMSFAEFKRRDLRMPGRLALAALHSVGLLRTRTFSRDGEEWVECNNLTLINLVLKLCGPMHERTLTVLLLVIQVACSVVAFAIRYPLAFLFYGEIIA